MEFIALEREKHGTQSSDFGAFLTAEAKRVWELQQAGILRRIHFNAENHTAVLHLECADRSEAESILSTLPLAASGLIEFDLIPLKPYDGFARLFSAQNRHS